MMRKNCRGMTLIELMISLVLSLLVVIAITEVYLGTRKTNRIQEMQERLTEDGRFALGMLQRLVSQAGYHAPDALLANDRITPSATSPGTSFTLKTAGDGSNIVACNGSAVSAGTTSTAIISFAADTKKLTCNDGTATDWIAPQAGGRGTEVISASFKYGVDTTFPGTLDSNYRCGDGDCVVDSYETSLSGSMTASMIIALKVCMVLRTESTDTGVSKSAAVKDCGGSDITDSQNDHKIYRRFDSTILLKNR